MVPSHYLVSNGAETEHGLSLEGDLSLTGDRILKFPTRTNDCGQQTDSRVHRRQPLGAQETPFMASYPAPQKRRIARVLALIAWLGIVPLAGSVSADGYLDSPFPKPVPSPTWMEPGEPIPIEGAGWTPVVAALENAEARVRRSWHNAATAQLLLTHARIRRYPRGEPFFEIRDRVIFLEAERESAENEFIALVERSRREGMPAGTLSSFWDFSDELGRDRARREADQ